MEQVALATNFDGSLRTALQSMQFAPHADASVIWSTQVPLHMVVPGPHEHVPLTHVPFVPQLCPQVAQLFGSVITSTQPPLHSTSPDWHWDTHCPPEHTEPAGQAWPHAPQFWPLVIRPTHTPEHSVSPVEHCCC